MDCPGLLETDVNIQFYIKNLTVLTLYGPGLIHGIETLSYI